MYSFVNINDILPESINVTKKCIIFAIHTITAVTIYYIYVLKKAK